MSQEPHPLDNPVWASLSGPHAHLALRSGASGRYPGDVAPFVAVAEESALAADELAALVAPGESVLLVGAAPSLPSVDWQLDKPVPIAQMVCETHLLVLDGPAYVELGEAQIEDMLALTAQVYPHYFRRRTIAMGRYLGIYVGGSLAAMAGERMRPDGHQEISAVCTNPSYTGRGYAQRLVAALNNDILDRGAQPFLHVSHENVRAKALYEHMGFRRRTDMPLRALRRLA